MAIRVTNRRRNTWHTRSNRNRMVKTPGGILGVQTIHKQAGRVKCGSCGCNLPGIVSVRPRAYGNLSKPKKTVTRAYGGSRCANCTKERILRSFLFEEHRIVKELVKQQEKEEKVKAKKAPKAEKGKEKKAKKETK